MKSIHKLPEILEKIFFGAQCDWKITYGFYNLFCTYFLNFCAVFN